MNRSSMDVRDTQARYDEGTVHLIDVRTPAEYGGKHIPGSTLIPLNELSNYTSELAELEKPLALVCRSGNRAAQARDLLVREGIREVAVVEGGIKSWEAEGLDLKEGSKRWDLERQVRFAAGLIVLTGVALGAFVTPVFYVLSGFVGAGLMFSAVTNTCAMGTLLAELPHNRSADDWNREEQLAALIHSAA